MTFMNFGRWSFLVMALAVVASSNYAMGQGADTAPPAVTEKEETASLEDLTPEQLFQALTEQPAKLMRSGLPPEQMDQIFLKMVDKITTQIENHKDATEVQKNEARKIRLMTFFQMAQQDPEAYGKQFDDYAAAILKEHPKSDAAALAQGMLIAKRVNGKPRMPAKELVEQVNAFTKQFPDSPVNIQVYALASDYLTRTGDLDDAKALLKSGIEKFTKMPGEAIQGLQAKLDRLEMVGKPFELSGELVDGQSFNIDSLKGKVVLVDFWATWCPPCVASMPSLKKLYKEYHDKGFEVVGVSLDEDKDTLSSFLTEQEIPWPQIFDGESNTLARKYQIEAVPSMFLVGRDGKLKTLDVHDLSELETAITTAVKAPAAN